MEVGWLSCRCNTLRVETCLQEGSMRARSSSSAGQTESLKLELEREAASTLCGRGPQAECRSSKFELDSGKTDWTCWSLVPEQAKPPRAAPGRPGPPVLNRPFSPICCCLHAEAIWGGIVVEMHAVWVLV